ncbi:MAG: DUF4351 domain-containing protein [Chloroflexota bacterium]
MARSEGEKNDEKTELHRIAGLVMTPVMELLGFKTTVELDVSFKRQIIDIICVRRERVVSPPLPAIYWEVFGQLNEHNLFSFKSYSESFNGAALEEFYGHLTNYCKVQKVNRKQVNLYVMTNHFPRDLLGPFQGTEWLQMVREDDVYELRFSSMKSVRFIICSRTDNPILALFSTDMQRVLTAYTTLQTEPTLVDEISIYWKQILRHIDKEFKNMYTKEDFLRDYPPDEEEPGILEWLEELAQKKHQQGIEQGIEQGKKSKQIEMLIKLLTHRFGAVPDEMSEALAHCTLDQLDDLTTAAFDAPDLDAFIAYIPELEEVDALEQDDGADADEDAVD